MHRRHELAFVAVFATFVLWSPAASAQDIAARVHLHAQIPLLSAYYQDSDLGGSNLGVGFGSSAPTIGLAGLAAGLGPISSAGVGYALDEHWVPQLGFAFTRFDGEGSSEAFTSWSVSPGVRYVLGESEGARPFASASFSIGGIEIASTTGTLVGGELQAGMQLPLGERVSVDPFLGLSYAYAHQNGSEDASAGFTIPEQTTHNLALRGGFHLSVWL
jgi:hypothetical protein